jgi:hypothetical protein
MRCGHPAWPAPLRPEINEDRNFAVAYDFLELIDVDLDGLGHRG